MKTLSPIAIAELWANEASYSLSQAAALWVNVCPPSGWFVEPDDPDFDIDNAPYLSLVPFRYEFEKILNTLQRAVGNGEDGELCADYFAPDNNRDEFGRIVGISWEHPHPDRTSVCRSDLLKWAKNVFSELPLFLAVTETETIRLNNLLNLVFDKDKEGIYSRRLAAAILAWEATYIKGTKFTSKNGHIHQIVENLKIIYRKELGCEPPSISMLNKIATVINSTSNSK